MNKRLDLLAEKIKMNGLMACLLTDENDIFYYTGYRPTSQSFLLVKSGEAKLFASRLENEAEELSSIDVVFMHKIAELKRHLKLKALAFDELSMPSHIYLMLEKACRLKPAAKAIKSVRAVKDSGEIGKIREAVKKTAEIYRKLETEGKRETDVERQIRMLLLEMNIEPSFPPIIAAGRNTAFIHHRPDVTFIEKSRPLLIDLGAKFEGYCADITRTCYRGGESRMNEIMENVSEMQSAIIDSISNGKKFSDLQQEYERFMKRKGYRVMHSIGHSIGLEVHEPVDVLEKGVVITVEPGIYLKGTGGARKEDMVLVTSNKPVVLSENLFPY